MTQYFVALKCHNNFYHLTGTLQAECAESFCHGIMKDGIELNSRECRDAINQRMFIRPQEVFLDEAA